MRYILFADPNSEFRSALVRHLRERLELDHFAIVEKSSLEEAVAYRTPANDHADLTILCGRQKNDPWDGPAAAAAIHLGAPDARVLILSFYAPDTKFALRAKRAQAEIIDRNASTEAIVQKIRSMFYSG